ncbi:potassium-transporting ATPase subunit KdpA [Alicyclobacillus acidocaldarius]|uniref:Potassium-transporting ATPase potassium-binding subunit n=2 Tax=Alicyclobacillus acidocaldarius subsp. acidocaldarius TaxID=1388 RepID=KDPA_ALIAD|nr:potassium-transporting ATPase subunit KdpA [Alicyclobacillus acidocaldarius]Q9XE11.1 RecName: Full=Potassium-transporting ATPase potassium-binding subunit; AltName: Full=ATP phosphohydrolase [potassium-transporting] A chain; AltName: Full=Potassium-binding and translocating subunit A; AltName: Full=Potassium-translocating ATPase A chain [Alicyclobacillus acidocaldarius subsp. acidocaldarius DSM 446]ACV57313.1 potassium-transporting ATPase, A subunit [Alicyclobacillus acidocaldarius subsp. acid
MTLSGILAIFLVVLALVACAWPLGGYIYRTFVGERVRPDAVMVPVERAIYRLIGVNPEVEMDWKAYLRAMMVSNLVMALFAYAVFRLQGVLPLNPAHIPAMPPYLAFNTAASFITNTNWQNYAGEQSLSYLSQMIGITFLQFTSAATGLAAAMAFLRGLSRQKTDALGNFWVDLVKAHTRLLLPIAAILAVLLLALGVPETLSGPAVVHTLAGSMQTIARGPVATLEAIKQLGTNGGGFFNANSAHPFENPNAWTCILEIMGMGLIPTALVFTAGHFLRSRRLAIVLCTLLGAILLAGAYIVYAYEAAGNPILAHALGIHGPNMEGKEVRFGLPLTSLFVAATTAYTTGAVNAMHDSLMPLSGMVPLLFMMFNLIFGGKGVGLLNILMFLIIAVFISGLMVGRTPEIFGKKIEAREMKLATAAMLVHPFVILVPTAIAMALPSARASMGNPGLHGFTEVLYAFTSAAANNGSAFAGLNGNTPFYNISIGLVMLFGRYVSIIAMLAIAGSLAGKARIPETSGTLKVDTFAFGYVFVAVFIIVGALTFFPYLALGPIGEQLQLG